MSRIRSLGIRDIRNFGCSDGEEELHIIKFEKPLTLISGPNGTGKTTIIESLKYVTTGALPPGSCGRIDSFVHDYTSIDKKDVRSLIKVEIVATNGDHVTVRRPVESPQTESINSILCRLNKDGKQEVNISSRRELDDEFERALGVSRPILNYVIFCHQEDSTWPLKSGKELKERFDQIFGVEKYNEAATNIRKCIKKFENDLSESKNEKEKLKIHFDEAREKQKSLSEENALLSKSEEEVSKINEEVQSLTEKIMKINNTEEQYRNLDKDIKTKESTYASLNQQIEELKDNIKNIHTETIDELQKEIANFDRELTEKEDQRKTLKAELEKKTKKQDELRKTMSENQLFIGQFTQQTQNLNKKITDRNRELSKLMGWSETRAEITEIDAAVFLSQLEVKLSEMKRVKTETAVEHKNTEEKIAQEVDELRDQKSKLELEIKMREEKTAEITKDASTLRTQVEQANTSAGQLKLVVSKLKEADANVDKLAKSFDVDSVKKEIEQEIENRSIGESSLDKINNEVTTLQLQSSQQEEINLHKDALATQEKDIQQLRNKHQENLKLLLKVETLPERNLKISLDSVQERLSEQVEQLNDRLQKERRELSILETKKEHQERELQEKNAELEENQHKITSMCQGKKYDEVLLHTKETLQVLQDSKGIYAYKSVVYKDYIKKLESCCPLCERNFNNQAERDQFKSALEDEVNKYPHELKKHEEQLKVQRERYDDLLQLKPLVDRVKQREEKAKELKQEQNDLEQKLSESRTRIKELESEIVEPKGKLAQCKDIGRDATLWDQYSTKAMELQQRITNLEACLPKQIGDKSMKEAQAEQESLIKSLSILRKRIEELELSLSSHNNELQSARETRNKLVENQLRMESEVQKLKQLQNRLEDISAEEISLQNNVQELRQRLGPVNEQLKAKNDLLQKTKAENNKLLENDQCVIDMTSRNLHDLKSVQSEIDDLLSCKVVEELEKYVSHMKKDQQMNKELESSRNEVSVKIDEINHQISTQDARKREIRDNINLKEKTAKAEVLQRGIEELRAELDDMKCPELIEKKQKLNETKEGFDREKCFREGNQEKTKQRIETLKQELNNETYKLAESNFINKCVEIAVQGEVITNLQAYETALEDAIYDYHRERINSVNKMILEFWKCIYQGNDTTAVEINLEFTKVYESGRSRKIYDYKVVQQKRTREKHMNRMKERCSAGQKVLASLIIRMALAQIFARKCGIFVLDEPTTNLDEANVISLADKLISMVKIRFKHSENVQLIVISHNESFVTHLRRHMVIRCYTELYQNQKQLTEIRKVSLQGGDEDSVDEVDADVDVEEEKLKEERKKLREPCT